MGPDLTKGRSPFYPGQPVPAELFVGRASQIDRIMSRGAGQVAAGKPVAMFIQGEYGIGKSSIAAFVQSLGEKEHGLHAVYAPLGGAGDLADVAAAVLEATLRSGTFDPRRSARIRNWLAKYVGKQQPFGFSVNFDALEQDAPNLAKPFELLGFLAEATKRLKDEGVRGVFLVLDEINGISPNPQFAYFIKGLVDANAVSREPLPLLLMLCGVEERRRETIQKHQPVDRIFDVIDVGVLTQEEMAEFFHRAFESVQMSVDPAGMHILTSYSAGFPKIMHLIGDNAYWIDQDGTIDQTDAMDAVMSAADDMGKKYVDQQVYRALRSEDYHSILAKIARTGPSTMSFTRADLVSDLTAGEKGKLDNFLRRMKKLNVIRAGDVRGEYVFNVRMVRLYIWLASVRKGKIRLEPPTRFTHSGRAPTDGR